jgi:hypothetical protein
MWEICEEKKMERRYEGCSPSRLAAVAVLGSEEMLVAN